MSQRIFDSKSPDLCRLDQGSIRVLRVVADGWLVQCETCHSLQTISDEELESISPRWKVTVVWSSGREEEWTFRSKREARRFVKSGFKGPDVESVHYGRIEE